MYFVIVHIFSQVYVHMLTQIQHPVPKFYETTDPLYLWASYLQTVLWSWS